MDSCRCSTEKFRYDSVFALASFQFCGHIDEYLIENCRRLRLHYILPRFGGKPQVIRDYEEGRLVAERTYRSSKNIFLYYWLWFLRHSIELFRFAGGTKEVTVMLGGHPVCYFGMSLMSLVRKVKYVYWIGDYFPSTSIVIRAFESVKRFYNAKVSFAYYLSDAINAKVNGDVVHKAGRQTLMWGMKPAYSNMSHEMRMSKKILFVGLLRDGQGIDSIFDFLVTAPDYSLSIVGFAANGYEKTVNRMIMERNLSARVYFPNRFHSQEELESIAKESFIGIAPYSTEADNLTHYADPGKVKAYLEMGLPVVMTRISAIVPYIEQYKAGEVVDSISDIGCAAMRIADDYAAYCDGVRRINEHFEYRRLYAEAFRPVEAVWE